MSINKLHKALNRDYFAGRMESVATTEAPLPAALEQVAVRARLALKNMSPGQQAFVEGCSVTRTEARRGSRWVVRNLKGDIDQTVDAIVSLVEARERVK